MRFQDALREKIVYEGLVSCYTPNGKPTVAPMGFYRVNEEIILRPYKNTLTYKSIKKHLACVINLTLDLDLFIKSTFKDIFGPLPDSIFTKSPYVNAPRVLNCYGY